MTSKLELRVRPLETSTLQEAQVLLAEGMAPVESSSNLEPGDVFSVEDNVPAMTLEGGEPEGDVSGMLTMSTGEFVSTLFLLRWSMFGKIVLFCSRVSRLSIFLRLRRRLLLPLLSQRSLYDDVEVECWMVSCFPMDWLFGSWLLVNGRSFRLQGKHSQVCGAPQSLSYGKSYSTNPVAA